ncbi:hypothetical protein [Nocardia sp. CA-290969]|uniref:hypothetical protein n=1 Tax=Nocardia sp. CA-290969 TaxID=3239986 RepID=UPI003D945DBB
MFVGLARVIGRLDAAAGKAARAGTNHLRDTGDRLRGQVTRLESADDSGARSIGTVRGEGNLVGTDAAGNFRLFRAEDVVNVPLRNRDGEVIGVSFPSRRGDAESKQRWARADLRSADFVHYAFWNKTPGARKPSWAFGRRREAPWATDSPGKQPIYIHAHARSRTFDVKIKTGRWSSSVVQIDGPTYGELIADNQHLERALLSRPDSPFVLLSCSPAETGGVAAKTLAEHLHTKGALSNDIYAAKGEVMTRTSLRGDEKSSLVGVEVDPVAGDSTESLWERFRKPGAAPPPAAGGT